MLNKYMSVFRVFLRSDTLVRLTQKEISERLGIPAPTVHRIVHDLIAEEFLCEEEDGKLRVGPFAARVFEILRMAEAAEARRMARVLSHGSNTDETRMGRGGEEKHPQSTQIDADGMGQGEEAAEPEGRDRSDESDSQRGGIE